MKKFYLLFLLSSCLSLIIYSFLNYKKNELVHKESINNLENLVEDSITPFCSYKSQNSLNENSKKLKELDIKIPKSRRWSRNLINASIEDDSGMILDKFKKRFNASLHLKNFDDEICVLPARVRISGDWKDHIQSINGNIIASMDIHLQKGNIFGITKFKLFIPSTRNGSSEVLISLLLKEMGYLSPRSKMIKVNLNNQSYEMIFQEKAAKEMLEHNKLRESAILESDESLLWEIRSKNGSSSNGNIFPKTVNNKWIEKNNINQTIGLEGLKIFSGAILDSWNHGGPDKEVTFSDDILSNGSIKNKKSLSRYKAHLIATGATHALYNHNRKFYYDPISKSLKPIFYDGNSNIMNPSKINNLSDDYRSRFITRDITIQDIDDAISEIKSIDLKNFERKINSAGVLIGESQLKRIRNILIQNLTSLKQNKQANLFIKFNDNPLLRAQKKGIKYGLILFSNLDNNFYLCNIDKNKCDLIYFTDFELNKVLAGEFKKDNLKYYFLGDKFDPIKKIYQTNEPHDLNLINIEEEIYIKKFGEPKITVNKKEKSISIDINNFNEKILFLDSKLKDWDIKVLANQTSNYETSQSRIDTDLLTSLITIKDSYLDNIKIDITGGLHEDSLNIINSTGSIEKVSIRNSFQDAIDFDFSNIKVNDIYVQNAGNDCIDTSAGKYFIKKLNLNGCKDKGVSVGEESTLEVKTAEIQSTDIALVAKDSSKLFVENAALKNNNFCAAAYNKKQEFGPSYISVPNNFCPKEKLAIQNLSILEMK